VALFRRLAQGDKDLLAPVDATCALINKLYEAGVPAINIVFPWTDHVFDLLFPQLSPPTRPALYDVDRFLALLLNKVPLTKDEFNGRRISTEITI